tara:strand:- start:5357 stop:5557 length:201 start_codon:yes stop_codon:yes gene_type:complete
MNSKDFKPHMMYDKKTGKGINATSYAKHMELKKKGYVHKKPKGVNVNTRKKRTYIKKKKKTTKKGY